MIYAAYSIALRLGMDEMEVLSWPEQRILGWCAFFEAQSAKTKKRSRK
jgi:hypothetical protein